MALKTRPVSTTSGSVKDWAGAADGRLSNADVNSSGSSK